MGLPPARMSGLARRLPNFEVREGILDYVTDRLDPQLRQPGDDRSSGRDLLLDAHPDQLIDALHAAGLLALRHEPTLPGYWCSRCRENRAGCDDRACVCSCRDVPATEASSD